MSKQFRALSNIEHGEDVEGGNEITRFPFGSIVEGLDKDTMKNLWDAGVLEEVASAPPAATKTVTRSANADAEDAAKAKADKEAADKAAAEKAAAAEAAKNTPPAAPNATGGTPKPPTGQA